MGGRAGGRGVGGGGGSGTRASVKIGVAQDFLPQLNLQHFCSLGQLESSVHSSVMSPDLGHGCSGSQNILESMQSPSFDAGPDGLSAVTQALKHPTLQHF